MLHLNCKVKKMFFFPFIHFSNDYEQNSKNLNAPIYIPEIRKKTLVYEKGWVIKHIKAPALV